MRTITWNMSGGTASAEEKWNTTIKSFFANHSPEIVIALQGCTALPANAEMVQAHVNEIDGLDLYKWSNDPRFSIYILFLSTDKNGTPCNLAFVTPFAPPLDGSELILYNDDPNIRPVLGIRFQQVTAFTMNASDNGAEVPQAIKTVLQATNEHADWFLTGCFNRSPESLEGVNVLVCPASPSYPSQNPKEIRSYLLKGKGGESFGNTSEISPDQSDSLPVAYNIFTF